MTDAIKTLQTDVIRAALSHGNTGLAKSLGSCETLSDMRCTLSQAIGPGNWPVRRDWLPIMRAVAQGAPYPLN